MKVANVALSSMTSNGPALLCWLRRNRPDVVTLQKIGVASDSSIRALGRIGYKSRVLGRQSRSDIGVGLLTKRNLPDTDIRFRQLPGAKQMESRLLTVNVGELWIASIYAPCPPPVSKTVDWLHRLRDHVQAERYADRHSILCGDFNVYADGTPLKGAGKKALNDILHLGFTDLYRKAHPDPRERPGCTRGYSSQFPKGISRLHLILGSKSVKSRLRSACVEIESRPWPRKDAPPLVVELDGDHVPSN